MGKADPISRIARTHRSPLNLRPAVVAILAFVVLALPVNAQHLLAPKVTYVRLESRPEGARVYDRNYSSINPDQSMLGKTPLTLPLDRNQSHTLWVSRDGYQLERVVVDALAGVAPTSQTLAVPLTPTRIDTWVMAHPESLIVVLFLVGLVALRTRARFSRLETELVDALMKDPDMIGRVVGDYRIVGRLGEGGFSTVYRAEHIKFGDKCALKILKAEALTPIAVERFYREMQLGRDVKHPGLVNVWAFGTLENRPYLVMDLLEGRTLSDEEIRLAIQPTGRVQLLHLFIEVCRAVAALHKVGLVHRDLKPDNIMVLPDGSIRVLDFGAAKQMNRSNLTVTGTTLGTPLFMSPEHLDAKAVDNRSDIYSAGVMLFYLMTGHTPFDGESTMEVLLAHLDQAPPQLQVAGLDPELEKVIQRMLAKDPADRYNSMELVVASLEPILSRMRSGISP